MQGIRQTIIFIKIQNTNTLDVKICPQICLLFVFRQSKYISSMSEMQGGDLICEQFLSNTTPARPREPAPLCWKQNYRVVDLLVYYFCLMFNLYF